MLQKETKALERLNHPNVVQVFDLGRDERESDGRLYLAMEYVNGEMSVLYHKHGQRGGSSVRVGSGCARTHTCATHFSSSAGRAAWYVRAS